METRKLGNSDLKITPVGFGAWALGGAGWEFAWGAQDDADSIAAAYAGRRELFRYGLHQIAQCGVGDAEVLFRKNDRGLLGGTLFQQLEQRRRRGLRRRGRFRVAHPLFYRGH